MKPLMLNGHSRALTQIRYNADGDLLFTAAKDDKPCVWYSHNGERVGTFDGHKGVSSKCQLMFQVQFGPLMSRTPRICA